MSKSMLLALILLLALRVESSLACTLFYAADDSLALAGKNEDWICADQYIWFCPPEDGKHGRVYFGTNIVFDHKEASNGVNDQGLFFGTVFAPGLSPRDDLTGEFYQGSLLEKILEECSSMEDALKLMERFNNLQFYANLRVMMGDKRGNSVIVELGRVIEQNSQFPILPLNDENPCDQFLVTHRALSEHEDLSVDLFRRILANVHVEGHIGSATTVYSTIYDLKTNKIYLYYFHNFAEEVVLDIDAELSKGKRNVKIESLFPENISAEDYAELKDKELRQRAESRLARDVSVDESLRITGDFASSDELSNDRFSISLEDSRLFVTTSGESRFELFPESSDKFFVPALNGDISLTFSFDDSDGSLHVLVEHELLGLRQAFRKID